MWSESESLTKGTERPRASLGGNSLPINRTKRLCNNLQDTAMSLLLSGSIRIKNSTNFKGDRLETYYKTQIIILQNSHNRLRPIYNWQCTDDIGQISLSPNSKFSLPSVSEKWEDNLAIAKSRRNFTFTPWRSHTLSHCSWLPKDLSTRGSHEWFGG